MTKRGILYARVSSEEQAESEIAEQLAREGRASARKNDRDTVSITEQLGDMRARCEMYGWEIMGEYTDFLNYRATQYPKKGKMVSPSATRTDRPQFLAALEVVRSGGADFLMCWDESRLVRHLRVLVAIEEAIEIGTAARGKSGPVEIYTASGVQIDQTRLEFLASHYRMENEDRVRRIKMGKIGTLKGGLWPGNYWRWGYTTVSEKGQRGRRIVPADDEEVALVQYIFDLADQGYNSYSMRPLLIARGVERLKHIPNKYDWNPAVVSRILRCPDYMGSATWYFGDGSSYEIRIPQIISPEQWYRVQEHTKDNTVFSKRNSHETFMLAGLAECGFCGGKVSARLETNHYRRFTDQDGKQWVKKYTKPVPLISYRCQRGSKVPGSIGHASPRHWPGAALEWAVWRSLVDNAISKPEQVTEQIRNHREQLISQGDDLDGDISKAGSKATEYRQERYRYESMFAKSQISEQSLDQHLSDCDENIKYWTDEYNRLRALRDSQAALMQGLDYVVDLLKGIAVGLPKIDISPEQFVSLPVERQEFIRLKRQEIVRALVTKVVVNPDGSGKIFGLFDGDEGITFENGNLGNNGHGLQQ